MDVNNDVENIYYVEEDTGKYLGMQKIACGNLSIIIADNKITEVRYYLDPQGDLHPMDQIPAGEEQLKGFTWLAERRPKNRADVTPTYIPPIAKAETPKKENKNEKKPKPKSKK